MSGSFLFVPTIGPAATGPPAPVPPADLRDPAVDETGPTRAPRPTASIDTPRARTPALPVRPQLDCLTVQVPDLAGRHPQPTRHLHDLRPAPACQRGEASNRMTRSGRACASVRHPPARCRLPTPRGSHRQPDLRRGERKQRTGVSAAGICHVQSAPPNTSAARTRVAAPIFPNDRTSRCRTRTS